MLAYIRWCAYGAKVERRNVCGVPAVVLNLSRRFGEPVFLLRRRFRRIARRLLRQGVRMCVFETGFPHTDVFFNMGLRAPNLLRFRRALLVPLTEAALDMLSLRAQETTLAVWGGALDAQTEDALTALCRRVRHIVLDMRGADDFCLRMQYRFGVSVQRAPLPAGSGAAQLALALEEREGTAHCPVLPFYEGAEHSVTVDYHAPQSILQLAASKADIEPLCAAFWELHALREADFPIARAAFSKLDKRG